jgi:hypothetical protein
MCVSAPPTSGGSRSVFEITNSHLNHIILSSNLTLNKKQVVVHSLPRGIRSTTLDQTNSLATTPHVVRGGGEWWLECAFFTTWIHK